MKVRLIDYAIAFGIILCLNFFLPRMLPGDPLTAIYGQEALLQMPAEMQAELVQEFGLDRPLWRQFTLYLWRLVRGDLGYSFYRRSPVLEVVMNHLPWTLLLVGSAYVLATTLGLVLGIESGWRRGSRLDRGLVAGLMSLSGFPGFFVGGLLLLLFGVTLGWFPLQGARTVHSGVGGLVLVSDVLHHLALPLSTLVLVFLPGFYFLSRNSMIRTVGEPYVLTAKAKGLSDRGVRYRHAARNAMLPVVTSAGVMLAARVVTGALFVEIVFSYPGMGTLIREALSTRDYPVLQGALLVTAALVLITNLGLELLYRVIDPRV